MSSRTENMISQIKPMLLLSVRYKIREEFENVLLTNKELNDYQTIVNDFSEIEDNGEEIENVLLINEELNDCQYIVNDISDIPNKREDSENILVTTSTHSTSFLFKPAANKSGNS
nr:hypothetical protein BgiMline_008486 [Biomphalaria glabrata]